MRSASGRGSRAPQTCGDGCSELHIYDRLVVVLFSDHLLRRGASGLVVHGMPAAKPLTATGRGAQRATNPPPTRDTTMVNRRLAP